MINTAEGSVDNSTIVRAKSSLRNSRLPYSGQDGRLLARCPSGCRSPLRAAPAGMASGRPATRPGSIRDRIVIGILTLIATGYGVAVLSQIVALYGL